MFTASGSGRLPGGKVPGKNRAENHAHAAHAHLHSVHPAFSVHDNFSRKSKNEFYTRSRFIFYIITSVFRLVNRKSAEK